MQSDDGADAPSSAQPWMACVALLFVGSGCAALVYEVVWFHLLRLVIGGSWLSLGILLASFMGGMCLGSFCCRGWCSARFHPLRVYAALELAIGAIGGTLPWWLPKLSDWYLSVADESLTGVSARAAVAAVALLPPTMLMGATLPAVARWVRGTPAGLAQLGIFYGANTIGAVVGCLLAAFVLLPSTDVVQTSYAAAAINVVVACAAWGLALFVGYQPAGDVAAADERSAENAPAIVLLVIALSGFTALGAEVVWTRLLAMLFGATVYTFAVILAVFLAGLGIGSTLAARWVQRASSPLRWLAIAQLAIACLVPYANFMITRVVPFWDRPRVTVTSDVYAIFIHDTLRASLALFPAALVWGASFPLALAAAGRGRGDTGRLVGQVYAANTLGAIVGSLLTSATLVPWIGLAARAASTGAGRGFGERDCVSQHEAVAQRLGGRARAFRSTSDRGRSQHSWSSCRRRACLAARLDPKTWAEPYVDVFHKDGRSATVAVQQHQFSNFRFVCIGGKIEASNLKLDLRCQRLLGHLPALVHPAPKKILIVGHGHRHDGRLLRRCIRKSSRSRSARSSRP